MHVNTLCLLCLALLGSIAVSAAADDLPRFDVPRLENIVIDGDASDWGESGFRVGVLLNPEGRIQPASDFDASFRLGWDERGLLLLVKVRDDVPVEFENVEELWQQDSVEIFVAAKRGSSEHYQAVLSPGCDPQHPELRFHLMDQRESKDSAGALSITAARSKTGAGYVLEVLLPWKNLALAPETGDEIGFQIYVNDSDAPGDRFQAVWYPRAGAHADSTAMHRLRLAQKPGKPILALAGGEYEPMRRARISIYAAAELADKKVEVREGRRTLASGILTEGGGRAFSNLYISWPPRGKPYGELAIHIDGKRETAVNLPNADEQRVRALIEATEINFHPYVFSGTEFPKCDFEQPLWGEELIGPYTVKTVFYDSDYHPVASAQKPGRYGAVVEIVPEKGRPIRRYRTLFRLPEPFDEFGWWRYRPEASLRLPKEFGIDPGVLAKQSGVMGEHLKWQFVTGLGRDLRSGPLMAGLYETGPAEEEAGVSNDVWAKDRQWWVGLKRKLDGMDKTYPGAFLCPLPVQGSPAPALQEGTAGQAGMKAGTVEKLDHLLQAWAADSDEGFAVCLARHGVIFYHKAFGQRDGEPMTPTDKSWMASITKLLSGTLIMMLVDQGLVDLDDPVEKFIPALRGIPVKKPLTIRHLYTHTNGLWGHWGDDLNDFEQLISDYYPYLKVGEAHSYNGAGYALGGKVIEQVSGEAIPQFFVKHLFEPLGCSHTDVTDTSGGSNSIPLDIAKIGQMLLNRGSYGNMHFFSEATFAKMLPRKLTDILGPETSLEWGIGVTWFDEKGLGKGTFGHGAASSATLRIDPVHDLVIGMTRNSAGRNFGKYHPQFITTIIEGIDDSAQ